MSFELWGVEAKVVCLLVNLKLESLLLISKYRWEFFIRVFERENSCIEYRNWFESKRQGTKLISVLSIRESNWRGIARVKWMDISSLWFFFNIFTSKEIVALFRSYWFVSGLIVTFRWINVLCGVHGPNFQISFF